ncbi:surfactin synthase thioesterase subunit [Kitasatospora sp. MAA19]|uniref:thioesterase II family protein n=1 Tax=unclassified Kitasatospora TaxID=2633591 RepID=UPI002474BC40|nr:alpha/beta fold hydrolase [Kitasatospora sp. MAA19]MDH6705983.1 surfactin synthase thioesterase subunit [Kitasatospora sp. MAA19]
MTAVKSRVGRGTWIRQYHQPTGAGPTLLCLPHAGGSATAYVGLSKALSATAEVLVVQYPGRQDRIADRPVDDIRELARRIADALDPWLDRRPVLFGHSMGSVVAYEVALELQARTGQGAAGLIASGRAAPSVRQDRGVHLRDDAGLTDELAELSGTATALLTNHELMAAVLPALRSDFRAVETYQGAPGARVDCPISAYGGAADPHVSREDLLKWRDHTTGGFSARWFPGGHFYLQPQQSAVAAAVAQDLAVFASRGPVGSGGGLSG